MPSIPGADKVCKKPIARVDSPNDCAAGEVYNAEACACFPEAVCLIFCEKPLFNNPFECGCITDSEHRNIFNHDYTCLGSVVRDDFFGPLEPVFAEEK